MMEISHPQRKSCKLLTEHMYVSQQKVTEVCETCVKQKHRTAEC